MISDHLRSLKSCFTFRGSEPKLLNWLLVETQTLTKKQSHKNTPKHTHTHPQTDTHRLSHTHTPTQALEEEEGRSNVFCKGVGDIGSVASPWFRDNVNKVTSQKLKSSILLLAIQKFLELVCANTANMIQISYNTMKKQ